MAIEKDPNDRESLKNAGMLFRRLGMNDLSIKIFWQLTQLYPTDVNYGMILADEYRKDGRREEEQKQYLKILDYDPNNVKARKALFSMKMNERRKNDRK
jgi:tetratricopeptide (TPR) repeat protein